VLTFIAFKGKSQGLGHYFRSRELALSCSSLNIPWEFFTFSGPEDLSRALGQASGEVVLDCPFNLQARASEELSMASFSALDWVEVRRPPKVNVAAFKSPEHNYTASMAVLSGPEYFIVPGWHEFCLGGLAGTAPRRSGTCFLLGGEPSLICLEEAFLTAQELQLPRPYKLLGNLPPSDSSLDFDAFGFTSNPLAELQIAEYAVTNGGVSLIQASFSGNKVISLPQNHEEDLFANFVKSVYPAITLRRELTMAISKGLEASEILPMSIYVPGHEQILKQLLRIC
jgi:hypothetical protein